ncbi:hypothetical protein AGABI2DRAFT_120725 [Agaricus bisporus var. bisporus H97]|uniref:hypothetical protein n=1 Tax=Agaricus bisporus var. bisporus (strain H97 / ATCC MYA-4626 / FGSC 10389) TaxID=936046 RepID=UPI00029F713D|nr:hypothetical protein AGABI2DRAFT_120725 [Agaricus bisporus var. bisporus H97]EKV44597.1 hypothetical protein AGABI2DRAFT_120725 [Agaricus bisporus var. bisporus H97]
MAGADLTGLPEEVVAAVEGYMAALEVAKMLWQQANSALKITSLLAEKESYKGSGTRTIKQLATKASATNKAYTTSLDKLKVSKAAAREARRKAEQMLIAHRIFSVELKSIDAALKTKTIEASAAVESTNHLEQEIAKLSAGEAAAPTGASSPLSSAPESPGCSGIHGESGPLPEPGLDSTGRLAPSQAWGLGIAAPIDVDRADSASAGPYIGTDSPHEDCSSPHPSAAEPIGAEQPEPTATSAEPHFPAGADYSTVPSTFFRKDLPNNYPIASWPSFIPGGFPHFGSMNEGNMAYALDNQLGLSAFNFPTGNSAYLDEPKSGNCTKGVISFMDALHGSELPPDCSSWIDRDIGKPPYTTSIFT